MMHRRHFLGGGASLPLAVRRPLFGLLGRVPKATGGSAKVTFTSADGKRLEPYETVWIEVPDECVGTIMQNLANRKGQITNMEKHPHSTLIEATITTRGLIARPIASMRSVIGRRSAGMSIGAGPNTIWRMRRRPHAPNSRSGAALSRRFFCRPMPAGQIRASARTLSGLRPA